MTTCLCAAVMCAAPAGQAPVVRQPDQPRDWRAWLDLVRAHQPGRDDAALRELAAWSRDDLRDAVANLPRTGPVDLVRTLSRALILHTDVAVHYRTGSGYVLPEAGAPMWVVADGRTIGATSRTSHWEIGRDLVARIPDARERVRIGRAWYRAAAAKLQEWGEYPELRLQLEAGLDLLEDDPVLLLYEGTTHQAYARPLIQRLMDEWRRPTRSDRMRAAAAGMSAGMWNRGNAGPPDSRLPQDAEDERRTAVRLFRGSLAVDPDLAESRVRLAEVLGDRGDHEQARRELTRAVAGPLPPVLEYYASLLIGREEQRAGNLDAARRAFDRARVLFPGAQAPRLGLSHLAATRGDWDTAEALLAASPDVDALGADPWFWIDRVHEPSADVLLARMREALSR